MATNCMLAVAFSLFCCQQATAQPDIVEIVPGFPIVLVAPEELAKRLESKDVKVRQDAVLALYYMQYRPPSAFPALTRALADSDTKVRRLAAAWFQFAPSPDAQPREAVPVLADMMLNDRELDVRRTAGLSLRCLTIGDRELTKGVLPTIKKSLADKDKIVRLHAATSLIVTGSETDKSMKVMAGFLSEEEDEEFQTAMYEAIDDIGLPAMACLVASSKNTNAKVRIQAVRCMLAAIRNAQRNRQEIPASLVAALQRRLADSDDKVVAGAILVLIRVGKPAKGTLPNIVNCLKSNDVDVRWNAAIYIRQFGQDAATALPDLEKLCYDEEMMVRCSAVESLGKIAGKAAIPALEKVLARETKYPVRSSLMKAFGEMHDDPTTAAAILIKISDSDKDRSIRGRAVEALGKLGPNAQAIVPHLTKLLTDRDGGIREDAGEALCGFGPAAKPAVPALIKNLKHDSRRTRWRAAEILGKLHLESNSVVPALIAALDDEDEDVRIFAARSLGAFGSEAKTASPRLTKMETDSEEAVRDAALKALKQINGK